MFSLTSPLPPSIVYVTYGLRPFEFQCEKYCNFSMSSACSWAEGVLLSVTGAIPLAALSSLTILNAYRYNSSRVVVDFGLSEFMAELAWLCSEAPSSDILLCICPIVCGAEPFTLGALSWVGTYCRA